MRARGGGREECLAVCLSVPYLLYPLSKLHQSKRPPLLQRMADRCLDAASHRGVAVRVQMPQPQDICGGAGTQPQTITQQGGTRNASVTG